MTEIPQEAVDAAADAIDSATTLRPGASDEALARAALEAAAPILADHVAKAILRHGDRHEPDVAVFPGRYAAWHRYFAIAARVAAGAFTLQEDRHRMVAEALERGDCVACNHPEVPE